MNTPVPAVTGATAKKSVLLVDVHMGTRESRAANLRKLGATVDCAPNAAMGLQRFEAGSYRLVLIDLGRDQDAAEQLAKDIRLKQPSQLVAFMVEGPALISKTLGPPRPTMAPALVPARGAAATETTESSFGRAVKDAEEQQQSAIMPDETTVADSE